MKDPLEATITGAGYGYVYVMSYPGSDKVKIGHAHDPTTRAIDIGGTLAPEEPVLEVSYWCSERRQDVERRAHVLQAATRANGEWFKLPVHVAMATIEQAGREVNVQLKLAFDSAAHQIEKNRQNNARRESQFRAALRKQEDVQRKLTEQARLEAEILERRTAKEAVEIDLKVARTKWRHQVMHWILVAVVVAVLALLAVVAIG